MGPSSGHDSRDIAAPALPAEFANHSHYTEFRELGRGGMGVVYLAKNTLMGREEVLKVINKTLLDRPGVMERFLQEIQSAARLNHPNVVAAYSAVPLGELLVFAMEYVPGEDLEKVVRSKGPIPIPNACYYVHQAALGLQHAHQKGMVHRDIKPSNLILAREGKKPIVKVLDFGLAKMTGAGLDANLTGEGRMMGTPDYIAPEQAIDAAKADIRSDIYSLGCTLYYLLTARPPFQGASLYELLRHHETTEARRLNLVRPEVPIELATIVSRMMAKAPEKRYPSPAEVAKALLPFVKPGGQPSVVARTEGPPPLPIAIPHAETIDAKEPARARTIPPTVTILPAPAPKRSKTIAAQKTWEGLADDSPPRSRSMKKVRRKKGKSAVGWIVTFAVALVLVGLVSFAWMGGLFSEKKPVTMVEEQPEQKQLAVVPGEIPKKSSEPIQKSPELTPQPTAYREAHGVSATGLKDWAKALPSGYRPTWIAARAGTLQPTFDAVANLDPDARSWRLVDTRDDTDGTIWNSYRAEGYCLVFGTQFENEFKKREMQIWTLREYKDWAAWNGPPETMKTRLEDAARNRLKILSVSGSRIGMATRLTMTTAVAPAATSEFVDQLTSEELVKKVYDYQKRGWRLSLVSVYAGMFPTRYLAVFEEDTAATAWALDTDLTVAAYEKALIAHEAKNMLPRCVCSHVENSAIRYTVLWTTPEKKGPGNSAPTPDSKSNPFDVVHKRLIQLPGETPVSIALSPDGKSMLIGATGGRAFLLDIQTGEERARFETKIPHSLCGVAFSADGKRIAASGLDGKIRVWDLASKSLLGELGENISSGWTLGVSLSDDGREVVGAGSTKLWEVASGKELQKFGSTQPNAVSFVSKDQVLLGSLSDKKTELFDVKTGKPVVGFAAEPGSVRGLAVSPAGKHFALAIGDHSKGGLPEPGLEYSARICDLQTGRTLATCKGHEQIVFAVAFMPEGDRLVTASKDQTVRVWDVTSGKELAILRNHTQAIWDVACSQDGKTIYSVGLDGVRVWDIEARPSPKADPPSKPIVIPTPPSKLPTAYFRGRVGAERSKLITVAGGTAESEQAVANGLAWLARQQKLDGSWRFDPVTKDPSTQSQDSVAATGMALFPFLGNGDAPNSGTKYSKVVEAGAKYLVKRMMPDGSFPNVSMYTQGIATMALCEAAGMYPGGPHRAEAKKAVGYIVNGQGPNGSWHYKARNNGDTSITGWQIQALDSASHALGTTFPTTYSKTNRYLTSVSKDGGTRFGYTAPDEKYSTTAVGLQCRILTKWPDRAAMSKTAEFVAETLPRDASSDSYSLYYASRALNDFSETPSAKKWIAFVRDWLIRRQGRASDPVQGGSWSPDSGQIGKVCGRLGTTALNICILQAPYRYPKN